MATKIEDLIEFHAFRGEGYRCLVCEREDREGTFLAVNRKTRVDGKDRFICDACRAQLLKAKNDPARARIRWGSW